jgi:hypothetical protein
LLTEGLASLDARAATVRGGKGFAYARLEEPVLCTAGETMAGIIADEAGQDTSCGFVGGYCMETLSLGPAFLAGLEDPGGVGPKFTVVMGAYQDTAGMSIVSEDLPHEFGPRRKSIPLASARVTRNTAVKDQRGLPAVDVWFEDYVTTSREQTATAGPTCSRGGRCGRGAPHPAVPRGPQPGHLPAERASRGRGGRHVGAGHDVPGLFIRDGSQMTVGGAANPSLTIVPLAIRQAESIADLPGKGGL